MQVHAKRNKQAAVADASDRECQKCIKSPLHAPSVHLPCSAVSPVEETRGAARSDGTEKDAAFAYSELLQIQVELNTVMTEVQVALNAKNDIEVTRRDLLRARYTAACRLKQLEQIQSQQRLEQPFRRQLVHLFQETPRKIRRGTNMRELGLLGVCWAMHICRAEP